MSPAASSESRRPSSLLPRRARPSRKRKAARRRARRGSWSPLGPARAQELALAQGTATLGRGADNTLVVPDISVSRRHARLEERGADWMVVDEGSGNGTRVNGSPRSASNDYTRRRRNSGRRYPHPVPRTRRSADGPCRAGLTGLVPSMRGSCSSQRWSCSFLRSGRACISGAGWNRRGGHSRRASRIARSPASGSSARSRSSNPASANRRGRIWKSRPSSASFPTRRSRRARATLAEDVTARVEAQPAPKNSRRCRPPTSRARPRRRAGRRRRPPRRASRPSRPRRTARQNATSRRQEAVGRGRGGLRGGVPEGRLAAARQRAQKSADPEAQRLGAALKDFERACRQAAAQQTPADAVRSLEEAAAADRAIVGSGESRPGNEVRKALSAQHLLAAASLKSDDQLPQAAAHLRAAVEANASNQAAHDALRRLQDRLHDLYLRG